MHRFSPLFFLFIFSCTSLFAVESPVVQDNLVEGYGSPLSLEDEKKIEAMSTFSRTFLEAKTNKQMTEQIENDLFSVLESDPFAQEAYVMLLAQWNQRKDIPLYLKRLLPIAQTNKAAVKLNIVVFSLLIQEKREQEAVLLLEQCFDAIAVNYELAKIQLPDFNRLIAVLAAYYQREKLFDKGDILFSRVGSHFEPIHHVVGSLFYGAAADVASDERTLWVLSSDKDKYLAKAVAHIDIAREALSLSFRKASDLSSAVDALVRLGLNDDAEDLILQNISFKPTDLQSFLILAQYYEQSAEYDKCFRAWERISKLSLKAETRYFYNLVRIALMKHDYDYAETALIKHLRLKSTDELARYQLGMTYFEQEKIAEALAEFEQVKGMKHAKYMVGISYRELHQYNQAVASLKEYLEMYKEDELDKYFYFTYSIICEKADNTIERDKTFATLIELFGDDADVKNFIGYSWAESGYNLDRALKLIQEAVEVAPNVAHLDSLLWVLFKLKRYDEAVEVIVRIEDESLEVSDAVIYDHFGDVYSAIGNANKARKYWRKALESESDEADFDSIRKKLGL